MLNSKSEERYNKKMYVRGIKQNLVMVSIEYRAYWLCKIYNKITFKLILKITFVRKSVWISHKRVPWCWVREGEGPLSKQHVV